MAVVNVSLRFAIGTLELRGLGQDAATLPGVLWDERAACHRAPALAYADLVRWLTRANIDFTDEARKYPTLPSGACIHREPRPYQTEALAAWQAQRGRGLVVLPTGAGKSQVACMAIDAKRRGTLVIAPTLDLVRQWYALLQTTPMEVSLETWTPGSPPPLAAPAGIFAGGGPTPKALRAVPTATPQQGYCMIGA